MNVTIQEIEDIDLWLINNHRLIVARTNMRAFVAGSLAYWREREDQERVDLILQAQQDFYGLAAEYERLCERDLATA